MAIQVKVGNPDYQHIGPLIASKAVRDELNDNIFDNENVVWFSIFVPAFAGFCCLEAAKKINLKHEYIMPEYRGRGYYSILFQERDNYIQANYPDVTQRIVTRSNIVIKKVTESGFKLTGRRGTYYVLER